MAVYEEVTDPVRLPGIVMAGPLAQLAAVFADGDGFPVVRGANVFAVANSAATNITGFDQGRDGQVIQLVFLNGNTTLVTGPSLRLAGDIDWIASTDATWTGVRYGGAWYELGRSVN